MESYSCVGPSTFHQIKGSINKTDTMTPYSTQETTNPGLSSAKVDPSYKSKRYRDKLRTEVKALENLLPVDRSSLHRKLDSQTVFRLVIAYFRTKMFLEAAASQRRLLTEKHLQEQESRVSDKNVSQLISSSQLLQALEGFLLVVTADGTILYVSRNIVHSLGFNQVDLMHRCIYGIVHPDDHHELKMVLETSLLDSSVPVTGQGSCCAQKTPGGAPCRAVSFLVRIKCFNGTTTGYLKMQCSGHMRSFPRVVPSSRTSNQVAFAFCRPFTTATVDTKEGTKTTGFWSKHGLDLRFRHLDSKTSNVIGYDAAALDGKSFYSLVHPEDLAVFSACHKALIHTEDIQTMYFRIQTKGEQWIWLHTRGKVVFKNSKKYSIVFTHCPVREEDSTYIQQEAVARRRYIIRDVIAQQTNPYMSLQNCPHGAGDVHCCQAGCTNMGYTAHNPSISSHSVGTTCPSTWHSKSECHSPVFPTTSLPHRYNVKEEVVDPPVAKKPRLYNASDSHTDTAPNELFNTLPSGEMLGHHAVDGTPWSEAYHTISPHEGASYKSCQERAPQRRYLMQVNGIGVAGQTAPTTLFFQGQFTAFTEPPPSIHPHHQAPSTQVSPPGSWFCPPWQYHQGQFPNHSGSSQNSYYQDSMKSWAGDVDCERSVIASTGGGNTESRECGLPTGVLRNRDDEANGLWCTEMMDSQNSCLQQEHEFDKQQGRHGSRLQGSATHTMWSDLVKPTPDRNTSSPPLRSAPLYSPPARSTAKQFTHVRKPATMDNQGGIPVAPSPLPPSRRRPLLPAPDAGPADTPTPTVSHSERNTITTSITTSRPEATFAGAFLNSLTETTPSAPDVKEPASWRPPCLYQSCSTQAWTSGGAACFRPPSPVLAVGVKVEAAAGSGVGRGLLASPKDSSDLPAIGSFLEYLKDISG